MQRKNRGLDSRSRPLPSTPLTPIYPRLCPPELKVYLYPWKQKLPLTAPAISLPSLPLLDMCLGTRPRGNSFIHDGQMDKQVLQMSGQRTRGASSAMTGNNRPQRGGTRRHPERPKRKRPHKRKCPEQKNPKTGKGWILKCRDEVVVHGMGDMVGGFGVT